MLRLEVAVGIGLLCLGHPTAVRAQTTAMSLTEAIRDFDGDGAPDTLSVLMLEGRRGGDEEPWCGAGEKYEGDFAIRVRMARGAATTHPLTSYSFFWSGEWAVSFTDYNDDGQLDFNLGQYASCNGWRYDLFTVEPSGRIRGLRTSRSALPVSDFANSTDDLVPVDDGFEHCYHHPALGHLVERYRWDEERAVFLSSGERPVEACPPPR